VRSDWWLIHDGPTPKRRGVTFRVAGPAGIDASKLGNIGVGIDVTPGAHRVFTFPTLQTRDYDTRSWASRRINAEFLDLFSKRPHLSALRPRNATPLRRGGGPSYKYSTRVNWLPFTNH
jgi:hypothetical protein